MTDDAPLTPEEMRTAESILLDRIHFMRSIGVSFDGARDIWEVLGYSRDNPTAKKMYELYQRGGLAGRVVDCMPKATWRGDIELIESEDVDTFTTFEQAWIELSERLQIWSVFKRLDILAGLGRFACLLLGTPGNFEQELPRATIGNSLVYVTPFGEKDVTISEWENDVTSPRYGLPKMYQLMRSQLQASLSHTAVHWSRVLHVAEDALDNEVYGQPRLYRVWNLFQDLEKVTGGGAEAFWLRANQGIQMDVAKDMNLRDENATMEKLQQQADEYQHGLRRILRTKGVTVTSLGSDVANFANPSDAIITQIAGAIGIPKRILTGSELGELASSQDRDNWNDTVRDRRSQHAEPIIVQPFIRRLIEYGYLPKPKETVSVRWSVVSNMTEEERAAGARAWADINRLNPSPVFLASEIRDYWYQKDPLSDEDLLAEGLIDDDDLSSKDALPRAAAGKKSRSLQIVTPTRLMR